MQRAHQEVNAAANEARRQQVTAARAALHERQRDERQQARDAQLQRVRDAEQRRAVEGGNLIQWLDEAAAAAAGPRL